MGSEERQRLIHSPVCVGAQQHWGSTVPFQTLVCWGIPASRAAMTFVFHSFQKCCFGDHLQQTLGRLRWHLPVLGEPQDLSEMTKPEAVFSITHIQCCRAALQNLSNPRSPWQCHSRFGCHPALMGASPVEPYFEDFSGVCPAFGAACPSSWPPWGG